MNCPTCQFQNRPDAKFCGDCGTTLRASCAECGTELRSHAKFCDECGTAVAGAAPAPRPTEPGGARKTVTILFADLAGSTALQERLDPESTRHFMERYYAVAREAVENQGGKVTQFLGDGVLAMFGVPRVAEDDALRAVRAGVAMQEGFLALAEQQREAIGATGLRVAINTGEVVVRGDSDIIGDPVNVAARLQERASNGDVVIGEATEHLVGGQISLELLGDFDLKGRAEKVKAYRVLSLEAQPRAALANFVGRENELTRLMAVYTQATETPATKLAVLLGSPGLGKSRLLAEFARRSAASATIITAHCDAAGGATFAPIADALRNLLAIEAHATADELRALVENAIPETDAERARIAAGIAGILLSTPSAPEESFFVVRRFLAGLCASRPVVLIIDDLQWAEPLLFDLVEHLVQWGRELPLLLLIGGRPELRDVASKFTAAGSLVEDVMTLDGLDAGAAMKLAANVIGADDLPAAVAAKVLTTSEGNPLFISELVRMLVVEGALIRDGQRWLVGGALATVTMPPTVHALLAARIERLDPLHCAILERAAVVGRNFSRSSVAALLPDEGEHIDAALKSLQRAELIEPDSGWLLGEPVLRFHHVLIRDAAYHRLLKGTRAALHEQLADWIEDRVGEATEHDEMIGRHLEDAHRLLAELGPLNQAAQSLGERAATRLAAAGRRALQSDDVELAAGLLGRAAKRLNADDDERPALIIDWSEALLSAGDVNQAGLAITELENLVQDSERLRGWHRCLKGHHTVLTAPRDLADTVTAVAAAASSLASLDDAAGEAKAHFVHALALSRQGQVGACEAALDRALAAARKAQDRRQANAVLAIAPLAALWGPSPVTRASGRCLDVVRVLRITQGAPAVESVALSCQGVLEALRGRTEAAHRMIASGREMVEELGISQHLHEADVYAGYVSLLEHELPLAESRLRGAYDGLRALGLGIDAARAAALLARTLLAQNRTDEAVTLSQESEELAGDDLKAAIAWRGVRAEALAQRGEHEQALAFAEKAVKIAASTDALLDHADARHALGVALRAAGQISEADAEELRAKQLWEDKGATLLLEQQQPAETKIDTPEEIEEIGDRPRFPSETRGLSPISWSPISSDDDKADEARARFAELTTDVPPASSKRLIQPNLASESTKRAVQEMAAKNWDAVRARLHDDLVEIDHSTGASMGPDDLISSLQLLFYGDQPSYQFEPLATLGPHLLLGLRHIRSSGAKGKHFDVGEYAHTSVTLTESDDESRMRYAEVFAENKLGEAMVRMHERYAGSLPEGPLRQQALNRVETLRAVCGALDVDRMAQYIAADVQHFDHRLAGVGELSGAAAMVNSLRVMIHEMSEHTAGQIIDVRAYTPDTSLLLYESTGVERRSGGRWQRQVWELTRCNSEGLIVHWERFDPEKVDEALARFAELTAATQAVQGQPARERIGVTLRSGVKPNAMTGFMEDFVAALKRRDFDWLRSMFADSYREIDHPTGSTIDNQGTIASLERLFRSEDPYYQVEVLATLGESLQLGKHVFGASSASSKNFDVGAYENVRIQIDDRNEGCEVFDAKHLADAIGRLYERYAQALPDGPERKTALAISTLCTFGQSWDLELISAHLAADIQYVDNRHAGMGELDRDTLLNALRVMKEELTDNLQARAEDVLRILPNALLFHYSDSGTDKRSGGEFERHSWELWVFSDEGFLCHWERFEPEQRDQALARFEELTAGSQPTEKSEARLREVTPNAASQALKAASAAGNTRNWTALRALARDDYVEAHHPTAATYGPDDMVKSIERLFRSENAFWQFEELATLGPRLCISRSHSGASGTQAGARFDVGAFESKLLDVAEVDEQGLMARNEIFAEHKLGEAVSHLYERYAKSLPDNAEHRCAAGISKFCKVALDIMDIDAFAECLAVDIQQIDHRNVGTGKLSGREAVTQSARVIVEELSEHYSQKLDGLLALRPNCVLVQMSGSGILRSSGGEFERSVVELMLFNNDGLVAHWERFEPEQRDQALARFAELIAGADAEVQAESILSSDRPQLAKPEARASAALGKWATTPPANAATEHATRAEAAARSGDFTAMRELFTDDYRELDHPNGATLDADGIVASTQRLFRAQDPIFQLEPLAVLGTRVALVRRVSGASATQSRRFDVGPSEYTSLMLIEVAADGRSRYGEVFAADRLGEAVARLCELYAEQLPEGSARKQALTRAVGLRELSGRLDIEHLAKYFAPDVQHVDHRLAGVGRLSGAEALVNSLQMITTELAEQVEGRIDDLYGLTPDTGLFLMTTSGIDRRSGGRFERQIWELIQNDADGFLIRQERFDPEQFEQARARFAELQSRAHAEPAGPASDELTASFCNAATDAFRAQAVRYQAKDWQAYAAAFAPDVQFLDCRPMLQLEINSRDQCVAYYRQLGDLDNTKVTTSIVATRGELLSLQRMDYEGSDGDIGPSQVSAIDLLELNEANEIGAVIRYAPDDLAAAHAELDARWRKDEARSYPAITAAMQAWQEAFDAQDWDALAAVYSGDLIATDHRLVGWGEFRGPAGLVAAHRAYLELAPDLSMRVVHLRAKARGVLAQGLWYGTRDGGEFENLQLAVGELDDEGQICRWDIYDPNKLAQAQARYAQIREDGAL